MPLGHSIRGDRTSNLALAAAAVAGVLVAGQARVNGGLTDRIGAPVVAALVSFGIGTVALSVVVLVRPRPRRQPGVRPRWWWFLGGLGGGFLIAVSAAAVPVIGVALLSVGVVAGQAAGGLAVDRAGFAPGGRHHLSTARVAGAVLAVLATVVAGFGRGGDVHVGLLALAALAGFAVAFQQAANGHVQRLFGDPFAAALVNFVGGILALGATVGVLAATGHVAPIDWPGEWWLYLGGLGGATYIALSAAVVRRLGVLRLSLASVAGQLAGGVVVDAVAPAGRALDARTLLAVLTTFVAVVVAGARRAE